jgi:hypothetical protein
LTEKVIPLVSKGQKEEEKKAETWTADETLERAKGQFPIVVVLGIDKDGTLAFITNKHDYKFMQWALSQASFELHLHERDNK